MKLYFLIIIALSLLGVAQAQDISKNQVPSIVLNNFKIQYPRATNVEWELAGNYYLVDFEMPKKVDHEIWFDAKGETVKRKEEIVQQALPAAVISNIDAHFKGYNIEEAKKVTTDREILYELELDAFMKQEWKVTLDANGNILSQVAD